MKWLLKINIYKLITGLAILAYIIYFSLFTLNRLYSFHSHYYDLGIMNQVAYNTSRGHILEMTIPDFGRNMLRMAIHFDPILAFFAPLYYIWDGPEVLLLIQTIVVALGAIAVYQIARKVLKHERYGMFFSVLYLLYYPLQMANVFDFHAVTLTTTFLLFAFYYILEKRFWPMWIFLALSFLTKENVPFITFLLGVYVFLWQKERKQGLLIAGVSAAVFLIVFFMIIPFSRQGQHFALKYFSFQFSDIESQLFRKESLDYLKTLLLPFGFLSLLSPVHLAIALPEFAINLLSKNTNMRQIWFHYTSLLTPFILISAVFGFKRLAFLCRKVLRFLPAIFFVGLFVFSVYENLQNGKANYTFYSVNKQKLQTVLSWQQKLNNTSIVVSSTGQLAPFFTSRRYFYDFLFDPAFNDTQMTQDDIIESRNFYSKADFVIVSPSEIPTMGPLAEKKYQQLKTNPAYQLMFNKNDVEVYKKIDLRSKI